MQVKFSAAELTKITQQAIESKQSEILESEKFKKALDFVMAGMELSASKGLNTFTDAMPGLDEVATNLLATLLRKNGFTVAIMAPNMVSVAW